MNILSFFKSFQAILCLPTPPPLVRVPEISTVFGVYSSRLFSMPLQMHAAETAAVMSVFPFSFTDKIPAFHLDTWLLRSRLYLPASLMVNCGHVTRQWATKKTSRLGP